MQAPEDLAVNLMEPSLNAAEASRPQPESSARTPAAPGDTVFDLAEFQVICYACIPYLSQQLIDTAKHAMSLPEQRVTSVLCRVSQIFPGHCQTKCISLAVEDLFLNAS